MLPFVSYCCWTRRKPFRTCVVPRAIGLRSSQGDVEVSVVFGSTTSGGYASNGEARMRTT